MRGESARFDQHTRRLEYGVYLNAFRQRLDDEGAGVAEAGLAQASGNDAVPHPQFAPPLPAPSGQRCRPAP
jgi:hypothetical protein